MASSALAIAPEKLSLTSAISLCSLLRRLAVRGLKLQRVGEHRSQRVAQGGFADRHAVPRWSASFLRCSCEGNGFVEPSDESTPLVRADSMTLAKSAPKWDGLGNISLDFPT